MKSILGLIKFLMLGMILVLGQSTETTAQDLLNVGHHIVINVDGIVYINHSDWSEEAWEPVVQYMSVQPSDLINAVNGSVIILCADGELIIIDGTESSSNSCIELADCPPSPLLISDCTRSTPLVPPDIPYLIYPRGIKLSLAHSQPTLHWTAVSGAASYSVELRSTTNLVWQVDHIPDTQLPYPFPNPLVPGVYIVKIVPYNAQNIELGKLDDPLPHFTVLSDDAINQIKSRVNNTSFPDLTSDDMQAYIRGLYLAQEGLLYEAIEFLTTQLNINPTDTSFTIDVNRFEGSPYPYLDMGDWYAVTGQVDAAIRTYEAALNLATTNNIRVAAAQVRLRLSLLYSDVDPLQQAKKVCALQEAREFYNSIGDSESAENLNNTLSSLTSQIGSQSNC